MQANIPGVPRPAARRIHADATRCRWGPGPKLGAVNIDLRSPQRRLIELRMEHADLDSLIDLHDARAGLDDLALRRMKKRRLALRDQIERLERMVEPPEPA